MIHCFTSVIFALHHSVDAKHSEEISRLDSATEGPNSTSPSSPPLPLVTKHCAGFFDQFNERLQTDPSVLTQLIVGAIVGIVTCGSIVREHTLRSARVAHERRRMSTLPRMDSAAYREVFWSVAGKTSRSMHRMTGRVRSLATQLGRQASDGSGADAAPALPGRGPYAPSTIFAQSAVTRPHPPDTAISPGRGLVMAAATCHGNKGRLEIDTAALRQRVRELQKTNRAEYAQFQAEVEKIKTSHGRVSAEIEAADLRALAMEKLQAEVAEAGAQLELARRDAERVAVRMAAARAEVEAHALRVEVEATDEGSEAEGTAEQEGVEGEAEAAAFESDREEEVRRVFHAHDVHRTGTIAASQLRAAMHTLGVATDSEQAVLALSAFDANRSRLIGLADFRVLHAELCRLQSSGEKLPPFHPDLTPFRQLHLYVHRREALQLYLPPLTSAQIGGPTVDCEMSLVASAGAAGSWGEASAVAGSGAAGHDTTDEAFSV